MAELRWLDAADETGWGDLAALFTASCREAIPDERPTTAEEWRTAAPGDSQAFVTPWLVAAVGGRGQPGRGA